MKNTTFIDLKTSLEITNAILKGIVDNRSLVKLTNDQYNEISRINDEINEYINIKLKKCDRFKV